MKTIIAGGRDIYDYAVLEAALSQSQLIDRTTEVISGGQTGIDALAVEYAKKNGLRWHIEPADWNQFGKAAGPRRNRQMLEMSDALIAIWDGESPGTKNMIRQWRNAKGTEHCEVFIIFGRNQLFCAYESELRELLKR